MMDFKKSLTAQL